MNFVHECGVKTFKTSQPLPVKADDGVIYSSASNSLVVTVLEKICTDDMAGMPYPQTVSVAYDGQSFNGCGGEPDAVLADGEWSVIRTNDLDVLAAAPITLTFDPSRKRFGGKAGCNTHGGTYTLSGEGLGSGAPVP